MIAADVLNAKADIFRDAFGFKEVPGAYTVGGGPTFVPMPGSEAAEAVSRGRREGRPDARDLIALGTLLPGHNGAPDGGGLAIFVQRHRLLQHTIVERAIRIARGEVRVIYTGPITSFASAGTVRSRPLRIGVSVGHHRVTAGTLGCFVRKREGGGIGILSNNHVLAHVNRAHPGDLILQPGKVDGGRLLQAADHVAHLHYFVPIGFHPDAINRVDAAYALLMHGLPFVADRVGELSSNPDTGWPVGPIGSPVATETVKKWGRTTGLTYGNVEAIDVNNLLVNFVFGASGGFARFDGQISIGGKAGRFSAPGDSGSVIFDEENSAVALLFAGSDRGGANGRGLTFASPIDDVLDKLDVDIYSKG